MGTAYEADGRAHRIAVGMPAPGSKSHLLNGRRSQALPLGIRCLSLILLLLGGTICYRLHFRRCSGSRGALAQLLFVGRLLILPLGSLCWTRSLLLLCGRGQLRHTSSFLLLLSSTLLGTAGLRPEPGLRCSRTGLTCRMSRGLRTIPSCNRLASLDIALAV